MFTMSKILKELLTLVVLGKSILIELKAIRKIVGRRAPGLVFLKTVREENGMLFFNLTLPPATDKDVLEGGKRTVVVTVGSGSAQTFELAGTATATEELSGSDNDPVVGTLVDTDDAGNAGPAREFSFVLVDTIAPAQPGEVGLNILREE